MNINEVLKERASRYGEFEDVAAYSQHLKELWYNSIKEDDIISEPMQEAMEMILHKLARIFSGDKTYIDNFTDLIGYSELYLKELDRVDDIKKQVEDEELMKLADEIFKDHKPKKEEQINTKQFLSTEEIDKIVDEIFKDNEHKRKEKEIMDEIVNELLKRNLEMLNKDEKEYKRVLDEMYKKYNI